MSWYEDAVLANELQWDGRTAGHYEAWDLHVLDPSNEAGWWLRYGIDARMDGEEGASLWGAHFGEDDAPTRFALKTDFDVNAFAQQSAGFNVRVSKAELGDGGASGGLRNPRRDGHALRWNLDVTERAAPLKVYAKDRDYEGRQPPTKLLVPTPLARAGGVVEVGGERFVVRGGRAIQGHRWGPGRFDRWTTGYATFFRERQRALVHAFLGEHGDDTIGAVHYRDQDGLDLAFHDVETSREEGPGREPGVWTFEASTRGWRLTGRFSASLQRMAGVRFRDPDGSIRYVHHAGLADATLELWKRSWGRKQLHQTLTARGSCVFQQGDRHRYDDVEFFV
jgi:hypothetical protein